jgi:hypothetical protein
MRRARGRSSSGRGPLTEARHSCTKVRRVATQLGRVSRGVGPGCVATRLKSKVIGTRREDGKTGGREDGRTATGLSAMKNAEAQARPCDCGSTFPLGRAGASCGGPRIHGRPGVLAGWCCRGNGPVLEACHTISKLTGRSSRIRVILVKNLITGADLRLSVVCYQSFFGFGGGLSLRWPMGLGSDYTLLRDVDHGR